MKSFLIIDGNSILNRAFYGVNARMTSKIAGIHTNAIYGFLNIFWMIQEKIKSDYVAVCFDLSAPTFRHKMYEDYKGTRKGMPDELREQLPVMKEVLSALNIPVLELEGFEADDLLGTVSAINTKNGIFTYILTGDRDSFQLISKSTSVILPKSGMGKTEYSIYDNALLMENYGISPIQVIEVKALMGDSSDNIPGVKGVGEKTAYQLIQKYDNIDNIYKLLDEDKLDVTPKVKEKLSIGKDSAYMSKTLATIILDANINLDYEKCMVSDINKEATYEIFKRLEFKKFLDKFDFSDIDEEKINQNVMTNESKNYIEFKDASNTIIINNDNIDNFICNMENILNVENISYIYNNPNLSYFLVHLGILNEFLSIYINNTDTLYIIELGNIKNKDQKTYNKVIDLFLNSSANKIGYNIKQDIRYFFNFSNDIKRFNKDIMIDYYLLDATRQEYLLEYILNDIFGIMLEENKEDKKAVKQLSFFDSVEEKTPNFLSEMEISNISKATKAIFLASSHLLKKLEEEGMLRLYNEIEMPLVTTLASMEHTGMHVDKNKIKSFDIMISEKIEELTRKIYELAEEEFNINSTKQLGIILFEKLGLKGARKTKTGYSTDKEVLEGLESQHEIIPLLLEYRTLAKLKSTYVDSLASKIESDNRIHTTFMQTVTATGRLSSVEPNLQNIPIRQEIGGKIREFFTAKDEYMIIDADYSQIELRMLADISKDQTMIDAFNSNEDIHTITASKVFNVRPEEVTPELRRRAKAVNFGIVYGISEYGLAKNINSSSKEAKEYIQMYLEKYSKIADFMKDIVDKSKRLGYVSTIFGRRRYIKEFQSKNKNIIKFGERVAMNTPIQGSAADIIKLAMNRIYNRLKENNLKSKLIMQVHDELLIECPICEVDMASKILKEEMENVIKLSVPLTVDLNVGKNWYEAK